MVLNTRNFGEIEIDDRKIITFQDGIPGFFDDRHFVLFKHGMEETDEFEDDTDSEEDYFWWLQSVDDGDVAFVLMDVFMVMPDYEPHVDDEEMDLLGEYDPEHFVVYNIVSISDDPAKISVNLKAPIIINVKERIGRQVVAENEDYPIRYSIAKVLEQKQQKGRWQ